MDGVADHVGGALLAFGASGHYGYPLMRILYPHLTAPIAERIPVQGPEKFKLRHYPAGTPPAVIARLRKSANDAIAQPEFAQKLEKAGAGEPDPTTPDELKARLRTDDASYGQVLKKIGLRIE